MENFIVLIIVSSPVWILPLPFISGNRIYLGAICALCFLLFTVEPIWTSVVARGSDSGVGLFLSLVKVVLAAMLAGLLLAVTRRRHHRFFFGTMLGCAVVGFFGLLAVRL